MANTCVVFNSIHFQAFLFSFLPEEDQRSLGQVNRNWHQVKTGLDTERYRRLKQVISEKHPLYMKVNDSEFTKESLLKVLGRGGSKKAYELDKGRCLMIPNMDVDPIGAIAERWPRMVYEEVKMSELLTRLGLLSPSHRRVSLFLSENPHEERIPAYFSKTFAHFETEGVFIIDMKNQESSTWKKDTHFLFASEEARLNIENWLAVIDPFLNDLANVALYQIPNGSDSCNVAIVKEPSQSGDILYKLRYFGFDFSTKRGRTEIPHSPDVHHIPSLRWGISNLQRIIDRIFFNEFGNRYDDGPESEKLHVLEERVYQQSIQTLRNKTHDLYRS